MARPIPGQIKLPGMTIDVELVDPVLLASRTADADAMACWEGVAAKRISITTGITLEKQWYLLSHELQHAVLDWVDWLINKGISKP